MNKKEKIQLKINEAKKKFPNIGSINWAQVINENPDVTEKIANGLVKSGDKKNKSGVSNMEKLNLIYQIDETDLMFADAFRILCKDEPIRTTAKRINVSPAHVFNLKEGKAVPTIELIEIISKEYGKHPSFFLEYKIFYISESIKGFLLQNPETATVWFNKIKKGINLK